MLLLVVVLVGTAATASAEQRTIEWLSTNPIFIPSPQKNNEMFVRIDDRLRIECPKTSTEVSVIHRVEKDDAEECVLGNAELGRSVVGTCLHPGDVINLTFRRFTPLPNALEFEPGGKYWFITTSTGENTTEALNNKRGGLCRERNMKLRFSVLQKSSFSRPRPPTDDDQRLHNDVSSRIGSNEDVGQGVDVQYSPLAGMPPPTHWPHLRGQHHDDDSIQLADDSAVHVSDDDETQNNPMQIQYEISYRDENNGCSSPLRQRIGALLLLAPFVLFIVLR